MHVERKNNLYMKFINNTANINEIKHRMYKITVKILRDFN